MLAAVEAYEAARTRDERIVLTVPSGRFEIGRYCPHAGEDLTEGAVLVGANILRCLGHNFEFDLETGTCVNARCDPLPTRRVDLGTGPVISAELQTDVTPAKDGSAAPVPAKPSR